MGKGSRPMAATCGNQFKERVGHTSSFSGAWVDYLDV